MAQVVVNVTVAASSEMTEAEIYRASHPQTRTLAYVALILCSLGLAFNAALVAIMQSDNLRKVSSRVFLAPLAICDMFVLLFEMSNYVIEYLQGGNTAQTLYGSDNLRCRVGVFFYTYLSASSSWLLVSFVVERYIWICTPQRRPLIKSSKRSFYVTIGIAVCMLAGSFPFLVMGAYSPERKACASDYELFYDIYLEVVFDILITTLTPSLYVIVCLARITWTVFLNKKDHMQMSLDANFGERKRTHEQDMSRVVVALCLLFLVSALPRCASSAIYTVIYHVPSLELNFYQVYWFAAISRVVYLLNYSLKFLAYLIFSSVFREALWSLCGYSQFDNINHSGQASLATVSNGHLSHKQAETRI